jgi:hypothetical protein
MEEYEGYMSFEDPVISVDLHHHSKSGVNIAAITLAVKETTKNLSPT